MKLFAFLILLITCSLSTAFAPRPVAKISASTRIEQPLTRTFINIGEKERDALTRDSEPEEFFKTNTDKMSDAEKLPIALGGVAVIVLPFLAGMIALYAAK